MKNKPKILVIAHEAYLNGATHSLLTLLIDLNNEYEFLVIIPETGVIENILRDNKINYRVLNLPRCAYFGYKNIRNHIYKIREYRRLKKYYVEKLMLLINDFEVDVIYTNTSVLSIGYDLSKKIGKPHIWHIREYGDLDFNLTYLPFKAIVIKKIKNSLISIFTTSLLKHYWVKNYKNSKVIYNGVFEETLQSYKNNIFPITHFRISIIGMVIETKGQLQALRIFSKLHNKLKNIELLIYGEYDNSSYKKKLDSFIIDNGLSDCVSFKGYVSNNKIYDEMEILLCCSKNEGFGRTIIEAMSYGIPIVSVNKAGPKEIVENNFDGFLYDNENEAVRILEELIINQKLYDRISKNSISSAKNKFSKNKYVNSINTIYKNALNAGN